VEGRLGSAIGLIEATKRFTHGLATVGENPGVKKKTAGQNDQKTIGTKYKGVGFAYLLL